MAMLKDYFKNRKCIRNTKKLMSYQQEFQENYEGFDFKKTKDDVPVLICRSLSEFNSVVIRYYVMFVASNRIICMRTDLIIDNNRIKIADIIPLTPKQRHYYNHGYGSLLIQEVIRWAKEKGYEEIYGEMVSHERNDIRQERFYRKNGFSIDEQKNLLLKL
jgi:N-acetylglutamate synthase-like GNAT family acetyltransferase